MSKIINIVLLIVIAVFAVLLVRANQAGRELKADHDRLEAKYGSLAVEDEDKFLVLYVPSGEKRREFLWRVYAPPVPGGLASRLKKPEGHSGSQEPGPSKAKELRFFFKYRELDGVPEMYREATGSASVIRFRKELHPFLIDHWDELDFEIMGESNAIAIPTTEVLTVFSLRIPERLHDKIPDDLSRFRRTKLMNEPLLEFYFGDSTLVEKLP